MYGLCGPAVRVGETRCARWSPLRSRVLLGASTLTACSSDPVPTGVTIGWSDKARQAVQVSWKDSDAPNRITIQGVVSTSPSYVKYLAGQRTEHLGDPDLGLPAGRELQDRGRDRYVDRRRDQQGRRCRRCSTPTARSGRPTRWRCRGQGRGGHLEGAAARAGLLAGRPARRTADSQLYVPVVGSPGSRSAIVGPGTTKSTRQVVKNLRPPYYFQLRATNEWTSLTGAEIAGRTSCDVDRRTDAVDVRHPDADPRPDHPAGDQLRRESLRQATNDVGRAAGGVAGAEQAGRPVGPGRPRRDPARRMLRPPGDGGGIAELPRLRPAHQPRRAPVDPVRQQCVPEPQPGPATNAGYAGGNVRNRNEVVTAVVTVRPTRTSRPSSSSGTARPGRASSRPRSRTARPRSPSRRPGRARSPTATWSPVRSTRARRSTATRPRAWCYASAEESSLSATRHRYCVRQQRPGRDLARRRRIL